jgi:hypothetical protein
MGGKEERRGMGEEEGRGTGFSTQVGNQTTAGTHARVTQVS